MSNTDDSTESNNFLRRAALGGLATAIAGGGYLSMTGADLSGILGSSSYDVERFRFHLSFQNHGKLYANETDKITIRNSSSEEIEISGSWEGDREIFNHQAFAAYSFDILEEDSIIHSTDVKFIPYGYQYIMEQTSSSIFITYQPSVQEYWDIEMRLGTRQNPQAVAPVNIKPEEKVIEIDKSNFNVESGQYNWYLDINPQSGVTSFDFPLAVGILDGSDISIGFNDANAYPTTEEAITSAASVANESATEPELPEDRNQGSLRLDGGHYGGQLWDEYDGYFVSRGLDVVCSEDCEFGSGTNRKFKINNITNKKSLTFMPD